MGVHKCAWVCDVYKHRVYTPSVRSALIPILDATHIYVCTYTGCIRRRHRPIGSFERRCARPLSSLPCPLCDRQSPRPIRIFVTVEADIEQRLFSFFFFLFHEGHEDENKNEENNPRMEEKLFISKIRIL